MWVSISLYHAEENNRIHPDDIKLIPFILDKSASSVRKAEKGSNGFFKIYYINVIIRVKSEGCISFHPAPLLKPFSLVKIEKDETTTGVSHIEWHRKNEDYIYFTFTGSRKFGRKRYEKNNLSKIEPKIDFTKLNFGLHETIKNLLHAKSNKKELDEWVSLSNLIEEMNNSKKYEFEISFHIVINMLYFSLKKKYQLKFLETKKENIWFIKFSNLLATGLCDDKVALNTVKHLNID